VQAERARLAVASSFALNGFAFASWVARVPAARDRLGLGPGRLGLLLLCLTAGATVTLPVSGALASPRPGRRRSSRWCSGCRQPAQCWLAAPSWRPGSLAPEWVSVWVAQL